MNILKLALFSLFFTVSLGSEFNFRIPDSPKSLDTRIVTEMHSIYVTANIFEGLIRMDDKNGISPAYSDSWTSEGKKITFHIRDDAKWSDGRELTAYDFEFGFKSVLDVNTASEYAFIIHNMEIVNAKEFTNGEVSFEEVGIKALDDRHLELTLNYEYEDPIKILAPFLAFVTCSPINEAFLREHQDTFGLEEEGILCNGPYLIKEWQTDSMFVLEKNPYYYNIDKVNIDQVNCYIVRDEMTAVNMYKAGTLDMIPLISTNFAESFKTSGEYVAFNGGVEANLHFKCSHKLLQNVNLRKAIAIVLDRKSLCTKILNNNAMPAYGLVPKGFSGEKGDFRAEQGNLFNDNNIKEAKALLEKAKKELNVTKFAFSLIAANDDDAQKVAQFIQSQLLEKLGIEISIEAMSKTMRIQREMQRDYEIALTNWAADYAGIPSTFFERFAGFSSMNKLDWKNDTYDKAINDMLSAESVESKVKALKIAEHAMLNEKTGDFAVIPLFFMTTGSAIKKHVKGVKMYVGSQQPDILSATVK